MLYLRHNLLSLFLLFPWCEGVAFPGPAPTPPPSYKDIAKYYGDKDPIVTEAPHHRYLRKRQSSSSLSFGATLGFGSPDEICGYVDGRFGIPPKSCPAMSSCVVAYNVNAPRTPGIVGCCEQGFGCAFMHTCVHSTDMSSRCNDLCQQDKNTLKCSGEASPYCAGYTMPDFAGATFWECTNTSYSRRASLLTNYLVGEKTWTEILYEPVSTTTGGIGGFLGPDTTSASDTASQSDETTSTDTATAVPIGSGGGSKTPVGPIVGGVVGGVLGIGLIGCLIFFIHRGTSNQKNTGANGQVYYDGQPHPPAPIVSPPPFSYGGFEPKSQSEHYDTVRSMSQSSTAASPVTTEPPTIHQTFYTGHPSLHINPGMSQEMPTAAQVTPSSPVAPSSVQC